MDIAVVVQRQIASTRAGVMFTVDPSTGEGRPARDRGLVRPRRGRGLRLGSPDRWVVAKRSLHVLAREVRHKELVIEGAPTGHGTVARDARRRRGRASRPLRRRGAAARGAGPAHRGALRLSAGHRMGLRPGRPSLDSPVATGHVRGPRRGRGRQGPAARGWERLRVRARDPRGSSRRSPRPIRLTEGDVLVAHMTAPDWVPLMRRAAAIVTDSGGMTCHAAIVSRELGIPCLVGTAGATTRLRDGEPVTVDAGQGVVTEGLAAKTAAAPQRRPRSPAPGAAPVTGDAAAGQSVRALSGRARCRAGRWTGSGFCGPS